MNEKSIIFDEYNTDETVNLYNDFTYNIGLLGAEKYILQKYAHKEDKLLDACCGAGRTAIGTYSLGFTNIVGVDICESMIAAAKINTRQLGYDISYKCCDILEMNEFEFDFISFWFNSLMVVPTQAYRSAILSRCIKNLSPNGIIVITAPVMPSDYDFEKELDQFSQKGYSFLFEYGDRIFDDVCFIHFPTEMEIDQYFTGLKLLESNLLDNVYQQTGRGRSLSYEGKFWVYRR